MAKPNISKNNNNMSLTLNSSNNNNNNNNQSSAPLDTSNNNIQFNKTTGWWTLPCKHITVYIGTNGCTGSWALSTTPKIKKITGLTKARYTHKSLVDVLKLSYLITIVCNDKDVYSNPWLYYNENEQTKITNKLFQDHNINSKSKYKPEIISNIWKETKKSLREWIALVCIIIFECLNFFF